MDSDVRMGEVEQDTRQDDVKMQDAACEGADEEDEVVRELDVYVCNGLLGASTSLYLFQYPLRAPWRPYGGDRETDRVCIKPGVKKVEMEIPVESIPENHSRGADVHLQVKKHKLTSSRVELKTTYAVGSVRGDKLLLSQLDHALQMRPSLSHMDPPEQKDEKDAKGKSKQPAADAAAEPSSSGAQPPTAELKAVQVTYERKETERQREARKQSHAYLKQQEDEEPWTELSYHSVESSAAETIWEQLMTAGGKDIHAGITREEYLHELVPHSSAAAQADALNEDGSGDTWNPAADEAAAAAPPPPDPTITPEAHAALPKALGAAFQHHALMSVDFIRKWLAEYPEAGPAKEAAKLPDTSLSKAVLACDNLCAIRGAFFLAKVGIDDIDAFRSILIELLKSNRQIKRAQVLEAARSAGVAINDSLCTKVIKSLCISRGNYWVLKPGV